MKLKTVLTGLALAASAVTSANAFVLFPGLTQLEDDNREFEINVAGGTAGTLEKGDRLRGVIKFQAINQLVAPFQSDPNPSPEITGLFDTEILLVIPDGLGKNTIVFGPTATFQATYGAGAMVALFTGGTLLNINSCAGASTIATCEANATTAGGGNPWATVGFGDADDQWVATNANANIGQVSTLPGSTKVAEINYALSILMNNTGYTFNEQQLFCGIGGFTCAGDGKTDLIGSGDISGGAGLGGDGYQARSDIDVQLNVVPEPGSLALFSLALAGLGLATRRRKA